MEQKTYSTEEPLFVPGAERPISDHKNLIRLNLGCGLQTADGWINVDGSYNARLAKYPFIRRALAWLNLLPSDRLSTPSSSSIFIHDIRKALPFPDSSVAAIYASHVLGHLSHEEAQRLVRESWRVLAAGGVFENIEALEERTRVQNGAEVCVEGLKPAGPK